MGKGRRHTGFHWHGQWSQESWLKSHNTLPYRNSLILWLSTLMVLHLCVMTPVSHRGGISDILHIRHSYTTFHNNRKLDLWSNNKIIVWLGVTTTWGIKKLYLSYIVKLLRTGCQGSWAHSDCLCIYRQDWNPCNNMQKAGGRWPRMPESVSSNPSCEPWVEQSSGLSGGRHTHVPGATLTTWPVTTSYTLLQGTTRLTCFSARVSQPNKARLWQPRPWREGDSCWHLLNTLDSELSWNWFYPR